MSGGWAAFLHKHAWLIFAVVVLSLFLGTRGLNEPDEGRYAEIGREMAASGDWLVPTLNGFEHFQKPPMLYWVTSASLHVFGINEWAARLPSALAALGVLLLTFSIGRKLFSVQVATRAAIVLVSCLEFFALARLLTPDMTMTLWIVAAIAAFVHRRPWLFFIAMGLGFLTKGPMALVVPLSAAIAWQISTRGTADHLAMPWVRGLLLSLLIGLSWFIALSIWRPELFEYFWRYELVERFASHKHGRSRPWWYFGPILLGGLMPWTPVLLFKIAQMAWQRWRGRSPHLRHQSAAIPFKFVRMAWQEWKIQPLTSPQVLLLAWIGLPLLVLSCSGSKLLTYVLPLLPAFALAIAASLRSTSFTWKLAVPATAVWLVVICNASNLAPFMARQASVRPLAEMVEKIPHSEDALLFTCGVRTQGFAFYMDEVVSTTRDDADIVLPLSRSESTRVFKNVRQCASRLTTGERAYGIVDEDRFAENFQPKGWRSLGREGDFLLITNDQAQVVAHADLSVLAP